MFKRMLISTEEMCHKEQKKFIRQIKGVRVSRTAYHMAGLHAHLIKEAAESSEPRGYFS